MSYEAAWLRYDHVEESEVTKNIRKIFVTSNDGRNVVVKSAIKELQTAFSGMFGRELAVEYTYGNWSDAEDAMLKYVTEEGASAILLKGSTDEEDSSGRWTNHFGTEEGYVLEVDAENVLISGSGPNGLLYGVFDFLRRIVTGEDLHNLMDFKAPSMPFRMLNHWDNMDGSIERGYSGNSFFFENNEIIVNDRTRMYARLAASVGINAAVINNVNVKDWATYMITDKYFDKLNEMAGIFAEYGIKLYMSLNYAAPIELGELDTADPLDAKVIEWWKKKMPEVFDRIQNLGGFLIKADSEGRPGPFTYGRTHADGANMLADAVAPFGGTIIWRCFVYNCQQDWRDYKTDRARSGYDNFMGLDGTFRDNVILQIKNGPMDFQVREPVHPLFGGLKNTNQMIEFQIAQEYTGQQRHVCYLIPMFKEVLAFKTYVTPENDTVKDIVSGKTFGQSKCGMTAVVNTGNDENWTGHDLAAANFYGFGRLAFDTSLSAEEIAEEWIVQTFGADEQVVDTLSDILMKSWPAYENYNAPLGIGWMVNPHEHYGPNVDGYEYDRWGTYHRADHLGIGVDRSHNGTGYALQYNEPWASLYDDVKTCPEELILFFHHVPYTYQLKTGKTVLQYIYDTHFLGAKMVDEMFDAFMQLEGKIDEKRFERMKNRLTHQKAHSKEWRDQINSYFYRKSGIPDKYGREIF